MARLVLQGSTNPGQQDGEFIRLPSQDLSAYVRRKPVEPLLETEVVEQANFLLPLLERPTADGQLDSASVYATGESCIL